MLCKATDIIGKTQEVLLALHLLQIPQLHLRRGLFFSYDDGVARQTEDSGGNLVTNGVAYGLAHRVTELINNFISGATPDPDDTEADGTISVQTNALQDANDRLDQDISNLETLLAQREQQMIDSFVRMEEMQAQLQNQSKMLESSIQNNFGSGKRSNQLHSK